ncbi:hypothetical protein H9P43_008796 [Blastocladiella emersonii ATCC 22665]|nr:hypothetical protein H9P43_008796 [Blastocladiella emersonii ATCC 22665]
MHSMFLRSALGGLARSTLARPAIARPLAAKRFVSASSLRSEGSLAAAARRVVAAADSKKKAEPLAAASPAPAIDPAAAAAAAAAELSSTAAKKKSTIRRAGSAASQITMDDVTIESLSPNMKIVAFCTAEEYDLSPIRSLIDRTPGFTLQPELAADVLHVRVHLPPTEPTRSTPATDGEGELFVFSDGSFVAWGANAQDLGTQFLARVIRKPGKTKIEGMPHKFAETEEMDFIEDSNETTGLIGDTIIIGSHPPPPLSKLAFSHGIARSTKIAVLESLLDRYLGSTRHIPQQLAMGHPLAMAMSRTAVLQKIGELLSVRALLNLSGSPHAAESLLDTPDWCWSKPQLEEYYTKVCRWLDVKPRIAVLNQKLDYAAEFANVLRGHLSEQHSLKLEWFIIILIAIEVVFGLCEWGEKLGYLEFPGSPHGHGHGGGCQCKCQHAAIAAAPPTQE